jgi:amidase
MDLVFSTTTELAAAIRTGRASATEALDAHLAQIESHNPALNAIVTMDAEQARTRARAADDARARGEVWGPLHGVPFTLKDALATAGMRTTSGFPPLDHVPGDDSTVAARLKAAGGILLGKTNVPSLLGDYQTANPIFGRTTNPWNGERTPGGSSGGSAAAVASGMVPFDIGTDLAGSLRIPAHFCGLCALKPTERRIPLTGLLPGLPGPRSVRIMSCIGPMARSVADLALLYAIIAGPDGHDTEVAPVPVEAVPAPTLAGLKVAYATTFAGFPVAAGVRQAVAEVAGQLQDRGVAVEEAALPEVDCDQDLAGAGELIGMMTGAFPEDEQERPASLAGYLAALDRRDRSIVAWEEFFARWDALLCPPSMVPAFGHRETGAPLRVDGREVAYWMVSAHTTVFNYSGHPAVVLPYTLDDAGLPIGVQLVGRRWGESRLLAIAAALAEVTGPFRRPPGY